MSLARVPKIAAQVPFSGGATKKEISGACPQRNRDGATGRVSVWPPGAVGEGGAMEDPTGTEMVGSPLFLSQVACVARSLPVTEPRHNPVQAPLAVPLRQLELPGPSPGPSGSLPERPHPTTTRSPRPHPLGGHDQHPNSAHPQSSAHTFPSCANSDSPFLMHCRHVCHCWWVTRHASMALPRSAWLALTLLFQLHLRQWVLSAVAEYESEHPTNLKACTPCSACTDGSFGTHRQLPVSVCSPFPAANVAWGSLR